MFRAAAGAPESEPEVFREPRMVAIEGSRRAAERLWREIGLLLVREGGSSGSASLPRRC
jgi:hypothetical protein